MNNLDKAKIKRNNTQKGKALRENGKKTF